jgi:hypothetical protein
MFRPVSIGLLSLLLLFHMSFGQAGQAGSPAGDSFAVTFSQTLLKVVEANSTGFRSIKGSPDPNSGGEAWFSTVPLPTARQCLVWIYRDHSLGRRYSCDFGRTFDLNEAQKGYSQALQITSQSLPDWSKSENPRHGGKTIDRADFTHGSSGPVVTLRLTEHGAHGYLLYVDVSPQD